MAKMTRSTAAAAAAANHHDDTNNDFNLDLFLEDINLTEMVSSQHKACLVYLCSGVLVRHPVQLWHCGVSPFWAAVATNCRVQSP